MKCDHYGVVAESLPIILDMLKKVEKLFEFKYDVTINYDAHQKLWFGKIYGKFFNSNVEEFKPLEEYEFNAWNEDPGLY